MVTLLQMAIFYLYSLGINLAPDVVSESEINSTNEEVCMSIGSLYN